MIEPYLIAIILVALVLSAFFSGIEIAFISSDKLEIELRKSQGSLSGKILSYFSKQPSWFISTTLIGNNICLVVYAIFMAIVLEPVLEYILPGVLQTPLAIFVVQTIAATLIVLFTAEFLPKSFFLRSPNKMLNIFAVPFYVFYVVLYPVVWVIVVLSKFMIEKIFRLKYSEDQPVFGLTDLNLYLRKMLHPENHTLESEVDTRIFANALEFKTVKVRECLVPRPELVVVGMDDTIEELRQTFIESGYSKILVYKESIDDIVGYCNSLDLFKKPKTIEEIMVPIMIVPETMPANELMVQFITERKSIALVVDEFGGTSGIVTIEDIIEEIFGEIEDEHDEQDLVERKIDDHTYLLSARHEIDYLNSKYGWELPTGDYDTLGGLILSIVEDIPHANAIVQAPPYTFTILSLQDNRIDQVKVNI
jgi:CBS domain containing-hemolysin-like protein